jgi:hypothetical protein
VNLFLISDHGGGLTLPSLAGRPNLPLIGAAFYSAHTCDSFPDADSSVSIRDHMKHYNLAFRQPSRTTRLWLYLTR